MSKYKCLHCGGILTFEMPENIVPLGKGDLTICPSCYKFLTFTDDGKIRKLTDDEAKELNEVMVNNVIRNMPTAGGVH